MQGGRLPLKSACLLQELKPHVTEFTYFNGSCCQTDLPYLLLKDWVASHQIWYVEGSCPSLSILVVCKIFGQELNVQRERIFALKVLNGVPVEAIFWSVAQLPTEVAQVSGAFMNSVPWFLHTNGGACVALLRHKGRAQSK